MDYKVFISYRTVDQEKANWILKRLEKWRTPQSLVGQDGVHGKIPRKIGRICLDRNEFPTAGYIEDLIAKKISQSEKLVVLCTPRAAEPSSWVGREIELFRKLRPDGEIHAIIGYGETPDCFPCQLRLGDRLPLAADMRPEGDGKERAVIRLIAGLIGVDFDRLWKRERRRKTKQLVFTSVVAASALLSSLFVVDQQTKKFEEKDQLISNLSPESQLAKFTDFFDNEMFSFLRKIERDKVHEPDYKTILSADLNSDGWLDYIVHNNTFGFCGSGGCSADVYSYTSDGYKIIGSLPFMTSIRSFLEVGQTYSSIVGQKWINEAEHPLFHMFVYNEDSPLGEGFGYYEPDAYMYCQGLYYEHCNNPLMFSYIPYEESQSYNISETAIEYDIPSGMNSQYNNTVGVLKADSSAGGTVGGYNSEEGLYLVWGRVSTHYEYGFIEEEYITFSTSNNN